MSCTEKPCFDRAFRDAEIFRNIADTFALYIVHKQNVSVFRKNESHFTANSCYVFFPYKVGDKVGIVRNFKFRNIRIRKPFPRLVLFGRPACVDIAHYLPDPARKAVGTSPSTQLLDYSERYVLRKLRRLRLTARLFQAVIIDSFKILGGKFTDAKLRKPFAVFHPLLAPFRLRSIGFSNSVSKNLSKKLRRLRSLWIYRFTPTRSLPVALRLYRKRLCRRL